MKCERCELSGKCKTVKITSKSDKSKIMLILDAPSKGDDRMGAILSSDVGKKFSYFLDRCGLKEDDLYITYAVKCNPNGPISQIKSKHVKACHPYLKKEIQNNKPKVIIAAGRYAYESLTGKTSVDDFRGHFEDFTMKYSVSIGDEKKAKRFSCKVMPTKSIDSSMTAWATDDYIINDLKKAKKYFEEDVIDITPIPEFKIYTDIDELEEAADFLSKQKYTFFDTETTGLYFYRNNIVNIGFTHAKNSLVHVWYMSIVPKEHMKKYTPEEVDQMNLINTFTEKYMDRILAATQKVMGSKSRKVAHNIKFDLKMLYGAGVKTTNVFFDTMVADALIDENKYHDLNSCMEYRGINFGAYDTDLWHYVNKDRKTKKPYSYVPPSLLSKYLAIDVGGLAMLFPKIYSELKLESTAPNQAMFNLMFEQQMPLLKELYRMEIRGFHADTKLLHELSGQIGDKLKEIEIKFSKLTKGSVKISSPKQIGAYFEENNYPFEKVNAKRGSTGWSVGEDTLKKFTNIKKFRAIPELILEFRSLVKLKSTYLDGSEGDGGLLKMVSPNGKFHSTYNLHIARTGRLSSSDPNCLSLDTEILTPEGWKNYLEIKTGDTVFSFNPDRNSLSKNIVDKYYLSDEKEHSMVHITNTHMDIKLTENHRCLFQHRKTGDYSVVEADKWKNDYKILHSSFYHDGNEIDDNLIRLACAIQADAHITPHAIDFVFIKDRKAKRLKDILDNLGISYRYTKGKRHRFYFKFHINKGDITNIIDTDKTFSYKTLGLSVRQRELFLDELRLWDGLSTRKNLSYTSINKKNVDVIQAIISITGKRGHIGFHSKHIKDKPVYTLSSSARNYSLTTNNQIEIKKEVNRVWCVNVSDGFILCRRGKNTFITGNCQNIPNKSNGVNVRNLFVPPEGQVTWECDFSQLELRVIAWLSRDKILIDEIQNGKDLHSYNAVNFGKDLKFIDQGTSIEEFLQTYKYEPPSNWRELPEKERAEVEDLIEQQYLADKLRKLAKKIAFGLNYGIEPKTVAEEFGISEEQANTAFSAYFKKYFKVEKFIKSQLPRVLKYGYLELPITGRRRRFDQAVRWLESEHGQDYYMRRYLLAEIERQAMNFPVQGLANEIYVKAKLRLAKALRKKSLQAKFGLTIHDGMVNTGFKEEMKTVEELVKECFKDQLGEGRWAVPLTSDFKVLTRWGGDKVSDY
jgi:uracil-DNA glycosylase family 4